MKGCATGRRFWRRKGESPVHTSGGGSRRGTATCKIKGRKRGSLTHPGGRIKEATELNEEKEFEKGGTPRVWGLKGKEGKRTFCKSQVKNGAASIGIKTRQEEERSADHRSQRKEMVKKKGGP